MFTCKKTIPMATLEHQKVTSGHADATPCFDMTSLPQCISSCRLIQEVMSPRKLPFLGHFCPYCSARTRYYVLLYCPTIDLPITTLTSNTLFGPK